ncbi:MAG: class I SAM-dependent methyltransferase [Thermoguttaceae bacterium]|jgi:SAM-dependent methyltransferase
MGDTSYTGTDNLEAMVDARNYNAFLVREVLRNARGAASAVDFGAGTGTFALALRNQGLRVTCIEPDQELNLALRNHGFDCLSAIDDLPEAGAEYVFSMNVLEHIENDDKAIHAIYRCLRPGGVCYLYVPAFNLLFSAMDKKVGHYRRYRLRPLVNQLRAAGFHVVQGRYVDSIGFFITLLYQLMGNRRGDLNPSALRFYDRFLFPVNSVLDRVLGALCGKNVAITALRPPAEARRSSEPTAPEAGTPVREFGASTSGE